MLDDFVGKRVKVEIWSEYERKGPEPHGYPIEPRADVVLRYIELADEPTQPQTAQKIEEPPGALFQILEREPNLVYFLGGLIIVAILGGAIFVVSRSRRKL